jgi:hypothetical protein
LVSAAVLTAVAPSVNVTVPVGVGLPEAETAAVKLTGDPKAALGELAVTVVEVALAPPALLPPLPPLPPPQAMPPTIVKDITVANRIIPKTRIPPIPLLRRRRGKARITIAARPDSPALPYQAIRLVLIADSGRRMSNGEVS